MESDEEFFDAQENEEQLRLAFKEDNKEECFTERSSFSQLSNPLVHHKHKSYSEFSHISNIHEEILPFKSNSWIIQFEPEGTHVAIAGNQGTIIVYQILGEKIISNPIYLSEHVYAITSLSWSNQLTLLSSSIDHTVKEWGLDLQSLNTFQYHCKVSSCAYLPQDNNFFVAAFEDFVIRTVYIPNKQIVHSVQLYESILCLAISMSGNLVAIGMDKGRVIPFRVRETDFKLIDRPILNSKNRGGFLKNGKAVTGIYFVSDDEILVTTLDSNIRLFNLLDYQMKQKYKGALLKTKSFCASISDDNKFVICGSEKGKFLLWNKMLESEIKNNRYESVKMRKKKLQETTVFAPSRALRILKDRSHVGVAFNYIIFSIDAFNSLKIFIC